MAEHSSSYNLVLTQQSPGAVPTALGRFHSGCPSAADVRVRAANVRAFRAHAWPARKPSAPPPPASETPALPPLAELPQSVPGRITVRRVLETTAAHFRISVRELVSHERRQPLARQRQVAYYAARRIAGRSLPHIARHIGGRDHNTIWCGVRAVQARLDAGDVETVTAVNALVEKLTGGAHG
jgi:Bacterial dnaA protein helix-turn-helix